jgi:hypothetical protein
MCSPRRAPIARVRHPRPTACAQSLGLPGSSTADCTKPEPPRAQHIPASGQVVSDSRHIAGPTASVRLGLSALVGRG